MARKIIIPNIDDFLTRYLSGESENKLAKELGVNRFTFRRRLIEAGITPRNQSESETIKWSQMAPATRANQVSAAHAAARGRVADFDELCRRAAARHGKMSNVSRQEIEVASLLKSRGVDIIHSFAVGPYVCDIGIPPVMVEIWGGNWHPKPNEAERVKYILDSGYWMLIVSITKRCPTSTAVADDIIAFLDLARSNPTAEREYRMIRGNGEIVFSRANGNNISLILPLASSRNAANGRYEGIPR